MALSQLPPQQHLGYSSRAHRRIEEAYLFSDAAHQDNSG